MISQNWVERLTDSEIFFDVLLIKDLCAVNLLLSENPLITERSIKELGLNESSLYVLKDILVTHNILNWNQLNEYASNSLNSKVNVLNRVAELDRFLRRWENFKAN